VSQPLFLWSLTLLWSITISRYREYLSLTLSSPCQLYSRPLFIVS